MVKKSQVMGRAWAIFRATYKFPAIPFKAIGRACFGWALKEAWRLIRAEAARAVMTADAKASRASTLRGELVWLDMRDANLSASLDRRAVISLELASLA